MPFSLTFGLKYFRAIALRLFSEGTFRRDLRFLLLDNDGGHFRWCFDFKIEFVSLLVPRGVTLISAPTVGSNRDTKLSD